MAVTASQSNTRFATVATPQAPLHLAEGAQLDRAVIAYETWGRLDPDGGNAIIVFHALSGSHHAAGVDSVGPGSPLWTEECHEGWWDAFIGPGKAIDTRKYFVLCCNYLGGCYGSTGPGSINEATGRHWGGSFPWPRISDIVDAHLRVADFLGIRRFLAAVGGSMGGFCVMDLALRHPTRVRCVIPVASGARATVLTKALNFEQIFAIQEDPNYRDGDYYQGDPPWRGLCLARMISHKTFVSLSVMDARARSEIAQPDDVLSNYRLRHRIESYMLHQGRKFTQRFDANTYLRIVNAWQCFDLAKSVGAASLTEALSACAGQRWLVFSIDSDVCFYPEEQAEIAEALKNNGIDHQYVTLHSEKGHDAFLLEPDLFTPHLMFNLSLAGKA